jgi:CHASE2 domain-containing sensor protein
MIQTKSHLIRNQVFLGEAYIHSKTTIALIISLFFISIILVFIQQWMPVAVELLIIFSLYMTTKSYTMLSTVFRNHPSSD